MCCCSLPLAKGYAPTSIINLHNPGSGLRPIQVIFVGETRVMLEGGVRHMGLRENVGTGRVDG